MGYLCLYLLLCLQTDVDISGRSIVKDIFHYCWLTKRIVLKCHQYRQLRPFKRLNCRENMTFTSAKCILLLPSLSWLHWYCLSAAFPFLYIGRKWGLVKECL